ncbi:MAG TPA: hypothetical protein VK714_13135 [Myxococcota bacterium]|nr:hypothetical protein [Myxococcota bacterium]
MKSRRTPSVLVGLLALAIAGWGSFRYLKLHGPGIVAEGAGA